MASTQRGSSVPSIAKTATSQSLLSNMVSPVVIIIHYVTFKAEQDIEHARTTTKTMRVVCDRRIKLFSSLVALGILGLVFMREHIDRIHTQVESTQRKKSKKISEGTRGYPNFIPAIGGSAKGGGSVPQVPRQLRAKFPKSTSGSWDQ